MLKGTILKGIGGFYYVDTTEGLYECRARGIFRKKKITPCVGDKVTISITDKENLKGMVDKIEKRKNQLIRPFISNISKVVIAFAIKEPNPNLSLLDRFIIFAEKEGLDILIAFTKIDLDTTGEFEKIREIYEPTGYQIVPVSCETGENINVIEEALKNNVTVFAGPSGVGKSSMLNIINPEFKLKTGVISEKLSRGKHTTRHAELFKLESGAIVADTPGFSSLSLDEFEFDEIRYYFAEFDNYNDCKFGNKCLHIKEPNCGVKKAVEEGQISKVRYDSYIQLIEEIKNSRKNRRY